MKILWITNIPSPYRIDFFNGLGEIAELTVIFERAGSKERNNTWKNYEFKNFKGIILNGVAVGVDKALSYSVIKYIKKNVYDYIVVSNLSSPTGIIAIEFMKILHIPYIIEGDGAFPKSGKGLKELFKKHLISGAKAYFSTGFLHDEYYLKYGAEKNNIYRYPFTSIHESDILDAPPNQNTKAEMKKLLGIDEKFIIISVGQFIYRKGFDVLLKACSLINPNIGLYIIGGEKTEEYTKIQQQFNVKNVHYKNFMNKQELKKWLIASDIFVLATREDIWGLVINEAMAAGLPIITTNKCIAGLELIQNNDNGFIVPTENYKQIADKINFLYNNQVEGNVIGKNNIFKIRKYTFEEMAKKHIEILEKLKI